MRQSARIEERQDAYLSLESGFLRVRPTNGEGTGIEIAAVSPSWLLQTNPAWLITSDLFVILLLGGRQPFMSSTSPVISKFPHKRRDTSFTVICITSRAPSRTSSGTVFSSSAPALQYRQWGRRSQYGISGPPS